jgi:hypothetical protein
MWASDQKVREDTGAARRRVEGEMRSNRAGILTVGQCCVSD